MAMDRLKSKATMNVNRSKGWECPNCTSYVMAGYDHCPRCGVMPTADYGSGSGSDSDSDYLVSIYWKIAFLLAPFMYSIKLYKMNPGEAYVLSALFFIPTVNLLYTSFPAIVKNIVANRKIKKGKMRRSEAGDISLSKLFVSLWVFVFSVMNMYRIIKIFRG